MWHTPDTGFPPIHEHVVPKFSGKYNPIFKSSNIFQKIHPYLGTADQLQFNAHFLTTIQDSGSHRISEKKISQTRISRTRISPFDFTWDLEFRNGFQVGFSMGFKTFEIQKSLEIRDQIQTEIWDPQFAEIQHTCNLGSIFFWNLGWDLITVESRDTSWDPFVETCFQWRKTRKPKFWMIYIDQIRYLDHTHSFPVPNNTAFPTIKGIKCKRMDR